VTAVLDLNRARSVEEFRTALRPWRVPTFNLVFADAAGRIAYQCTGRIPLRKVRERGYRPGDDPRHRWDGLIPEDGMPAQVDPPRGFLVTANNRVVPDDFAYPLSGTWITGYRARRIRELLEARPRMSRDDQRQLQLDVHSGRGAACLPALLKTLANEPDHRVRQAVNHLKTWDLQVRASSVAATVFNIFFVHWCRAVAAERLPRDAVELVASLAGPLAVRLLHEDPHGWFIHHDRHRAVGAAFHAALDELTNRLGADIDGWTWGRLHRLVQKHFLSARGDLGKLLDHPALEVDGDGHTVNSSTPDAHHAAWLGAGFRLIADLGDAMAGWWSVECGSASGHPGSTHYSDQLAQWRAGGLFYTALLAAPEGEVLVLVPGQTSSRS
jgi:penicillin amidase